MYKSPFVAVVFLVSAMATVALAQPATQTEPTKEQLEIWLRQYPAADADQDGVLTVPEAEAYRRRLVQQRRKQEGTPDDEFATDFAFATMSDGVDIALAIGFPRGFDPQDTERKWPALFEMMGYPDSTMPRPPRDFGDRYVTVRAFGARCRSVGRHHPCHQSTYRYGRA